MADIMGQFWRWRCRCCAGYKQSFTSWPQILHRWSKGTGWAQVMPAAGPLVMGDPGGGGKPGGFAGRGGDICHTLSETFQTNAASKSIAGIY
jgi:hypothetical protein